MWLWLWWWWSRRDVNEMCLSIPHHSAPNYGGRVPVDTAPGPVPVYRALKKSTPQLIKPRRQDLVDELQLRVNHSVPDTPTGMSTALSKYCLGPHVEATPGHRPPVVAHQRACNNLSKPPRTATVGAQLSPPRLHTNSMDLTTGTSIIL